MFERTDATAERGIATMSNFNEGGSYHRRRRDVNDASRSATPT